MAVFRGKWQKVGLGNVFAARIIASEEFRNLSLVHIFPFKVPGREEIGPRGRLLCFRKTFIDGEKIKLFKINQNDYIKNLIKSAKVCKKLPLPNSSVFTVVSFFS